MDQGCDWEVWDLERAVDRVAEPVKPTQDGTFVGGLAACTSSEASRVSGSGPVRGLGQL